MFGHYFHNKKTLYLIVRLEKNRWMQYAQHIYLMMQTININ